MALLPQVFTVPTMVTGASMTPAAQLLGSYLYMYLVVPGMGQYSASTPIYLQTSADGVTYYRFSNSENNTLTVGVNDFQVASSTSQRIIYIPNFAFKYVKVEVSGTVTTPTSPFQIITVSNQ